MIDRTQNGELGTAQQIPQSLVDRVSGAVRSWARDVASEWLSPLLPLKPVAPDGSIPRSRDYEVGYNIATQPRAYERVKFDTLRSLAENYDLMRGVIETRKDQVSAFPWVIRLKREDGEPDKKFAERNKSDARLKTLNEFFAMPDKEHNFRAWIRELTEEVLVIDAPCVFPRFTFGGKLHAFDLIDGATIKRVIDIEGKTPRAPFTAYQQIIKGMPYCDFTRPQLDDVRIPQLVYMPRNPRVSRVYGLSPVEQVMMTVNIALRRQMHQLAYFTEGNIPDAIAGVPDEWTPDQISKFEARWDEIFAGQSGNRRKIHFVPWGGSGTLPITFTKEQTLKDELDEYIVRVICFFFSIQPTALVKMVNRASGEQMSADAKDEGLAPLLSYLSDYINFLIRFYFQYDDIEFAFEAKQTASATEQSEIDERDLKNGVISIDDRREKLGLEPIGANKPMLLVGNEPVLVSEIVSGEYRERKDAQAAERQAALANSAASVNTSANGNGANGKNGKKPKTGTSQAATAAGSQKVAEKSSKKKLVVSIATMSKPMRKRAKALTSSISQFFDNEGKRIASDIAAAYADATGQKFVGTRDLFTKAQRDVDSILSQLDIESWDEIVEMVLEPLELTYEEGARSALVKFGIDDAAAIFDLVEPWSVEYAQRRSAELVGMKRDPLGNLYENPNPKWSIKNTTRERIRQLVENALTDGMTPKELADAIETDFAFSEHRAQTIARTELAMANVAGNGKSARESGVAVEKQWILGSEHDEIGCKCEDNAKQGRIGIDDDFDSGADEPPHPNCVCDIVFYTTREADESVE